MKCQHADVNASKVVALLGRASQNKEGKVLIPKRRIKRGYLTFKLAIAQRLEWKK